MQTTLLKYNKYNAFPTAYFMIPSNILFLYLGTETCTSYPLVISRGTFL